MIITTNNMTKTSQLLVHYNWCQAQISRRGLLKFIKLRELGKRCSADGKIQRLFALYRRCNMMQDEKGDADS